MDREGWNRRYEGRELVWTGDANRFLVAEVERLAPGRALDLACGEGRNAVWLAERGFTVTGVDFSDVALAKGELLAESRGVSVEWVVADVLDYAPPPAGFDLVVVLYLQLPAEERAVAHATAASAVAPGGTLLVVGHDSANLDRGYGGPQDPAVLFTPQEVAREVAPLKVERAETVRRSVATPDGEVDALDALVRARAPRPD